MKVNLTNQEYKNLVNQFSYDLDIKPEIYRVLKFNHNIENIGISSSEEMNLVFNIQDEVLRMYKLKN